MRGADVGEGSAAGERRARRRKPCCALARPPPVAAGGSTRPVLMTIGRHPGLRQELVDRRQVLDQRDGSDHDAALMASALVTSAVEGGPASTASPTAGTPPLPQRRDGCRRRLTPHGTPLTGSIVSCLASLVEQR